MKPRNYEYSNYDAKPALDRWFTSYHSNEEEPDKPKEKESEATIKEKGVPQKAKKTAENESRKEVKKDRSDEESKREETKQEKRTEAVWRSLAYKKQFEEEPVPDDPEVLARLIVAEQVLAIDEHLKDPEATDKKEDLEETLDYLCLLAEKFENPEEESSPSIELAYEQLLELTRDSLDEDLDSVTILEHVEEMLRSQEQGSFELISDTTLPSPASPAPDAHMDTPNSKKTSTVSGLVQFISYLRKASAKPATPVTEAAATADRSDLTRYTPSGGDYFAADSTSSRPQEIESRLAPIDRPMPRDAAEYHTSTLPRSSLRPLAALALASAIAIKAVFPERVPSSEATPQSIPESPADETPKPLKSMSEATPIPSSVPPTKPERLPNIGPVAASPKDVAFAMRPEPVRPAPTRNDVLPHFSSHDSQAIATAFDRKLEHMPLLRLLSLAHGVSLGYGKYLKEEFEKGNIDKEGLIKVLKTRSKGKDYSSEYRRQVTRYQQVRTSPEFLRRSVPPPLVPLVAPNKKEEAESPDETPAPIASPKTLPKPTPLSVKPSIVEPPREEPKPPQNTPWVIAIVAGLAVLSVLVWTLIN